MEWQLDPSWRLPSSPSATTTVTSSQPTASLWCCCHFSILNLNPTIRLLTTLKKKKRKRVPPSEFYNNKKQFKVASTQLLCTYRRPIQFNSIQFNGDIRFFLNCGIASINPQTDSRSQRQSAQSVTRADCTSRRNNSTSKITTSVCFFLSLYLH